MTYAFKAGERLLKSHPAVEACPGGFRPYDATAELIYGAGR